MCVTFTGCELLCCETSNWQQKSHATLKSKLRVQIKMKVMKDRNAKACRGFVWIKPVSARDGVRGGSVFPGGVRKATDQVCDSPGEGTPRWVIPGGTRNGSGSYCPSLSSAWKERSLGVPGRWIWKPESHPVAVLWFRGKAIGQEGLGFSPREGERWFPCSPRGLIETKTRLNVSANEIYKNLSKWTSRWVGGTNVNPNLGSHIKTYRISTRFVLWATGSLQKVL